MTYDEMIEILQAAKAGKVIEWQSVQGDWQRFSGTGFDFLRYKYRVKPEPKRCWVKFRGDVALEPVSDHEVPGWTEMVEVVR